MSKPKPTKKQQQPMTASEAKVVAFAVQGVVKQLYEIMGKLHRIEPEIATLEVQDFVPAARQLLSITYGQVERRMREYEQRAERLHNHNKAQIDQLERVKKELLAAKRKAKKAAAPGDRDQADGH